MSVISKSQAMILAKFIEAIRPSWNFHGIMAAIGTAANRGSAGDLAIAMITAATTDAETPAAIVNSVYWPSVGPKSEATRQAQYRDDIERAKYRRLKAEAERAEHVAATPEQIRAIRNNLKEAK